MRSTIFALALLLTNAALAEVGPTVECRFAARDDRGVGIDESVVFEVNPGAFVEGDFFPYEFKLTGRATAFEVNVRLDGRLISRLNFPIIQLLDLPVGASLFGISTAFHRIVDGYDSIQYECKKIL